MIGDWVLAIALPIYTYDLTPSSLATGAMFMVGTMPRIVFGPLAGVLVDRWDRRRTMVVTDFTQAALVAVLLLVQSPQQVWLIYLVAFLESTVSQFFGPAENALLPQLVDERHLVPANSLNALNNNLARLAGPALGGLLLGGLGFRSVVLVDCLSFLISGVMIAGITTQAGQRRVVGADELAATSSKKVQTRVSSLVRQLWQEWLEGLRLV